MAADYNIWINQGEDYLQYCKWMLVDGITPFSLTNVTFRGQIRASAASVGILANFNVQLIDAAQGTFSISIPNSVTAQLPTAGENFSKTARYAYDIEAVLPDNSVIRVLNGSVIVSPEVTKIG